MSPLKQRMLEDMQLRGLSARTQEAHARAVWQLAQYYHRRPEQLSDEDLRQHFLYLANEKKIARPTTSIALCGIKFFARHFASRRATRAYSCYRRLQESYAGAARHRTWREFGFQIAPEYSYMMDESLVSVVVPLRNESRSLPMLIDSLRQQTLPPAEIILVDGGSSDGTAALARELTQDDSRFRVLEIGPATPGRGRNAGIAAAREEWIALTDGGIHLEPAWLGELMATAERQPGTDVVYGNYEPIIDSFFKQCAALVYVPLKQTRSDGSRIRGPSIASMLLRREAWRQVGGIPDLRAAEDLIFMEQIEQQGFKISWAPRATVWWQLQPTLSSTFRKFAVYSCHNVWAGRQWDWHYGLRRQYIVGLIFFALALAHSWWWLALPVAGTLARAAKSIYVRREGRGMAWLLSPAQFAGVVFVMLAVDLATFVGWAQALWLRGGPRRRRESKSAEAEFGSGTAMTNAKPLKTLYLCYFGLREPLVQTQVLPYLRQLAAAGIKVHLLTFEPRLRERWSEDEMTKQRERLRAEGIIWFCLSYHKSPSVPGTVYDIVAGARFALKLARREGINMLHARAHVPLAMALLAAKLLPRVRIIFDIRGLMADEYADAGVWRIDSTIFRTVKKLERAGIRRADGIVVLTQRMRDWLVGERLAAAEKIQVIPCCVDLSQYKASPAQGTVETAVTNDAEARFEVVYAGSVTGLYMLEEMGRFFRELRARCPGAFFRVLTMSSPEQAASILRRAGLNDGDFQVSGVPAAEVPALLRRARLGISFRKPTFSQIAASPTKISEYLAAGLPVVSNQGIGDIDELLEGERIGVVVRRFDRDNLTLVADKALALAGETDIAARCRAAAQMHFDLASVGGARYLNVYRRLGG